MEYPIPEGYVRPLKTRGNMRLAWAFLFLGDWAAYGALSASQRLHWIGRYHLWAALVLGGFFARMHILVRGFGMVRRDEMGLYDMYCT
jgi:hypothetical protein